MCNVAIGKPTTSAAASLKQSSSLAFVFGEFGFLIAMASEVS
jgi:hypothetical protein